jgi:hypothetical protein
LTQYVLDDKRYKQLQIAQTYPDHQLNTQHKDPQYIVAFCENGNHIYIFMYTVYTSKYDTNGKYIITYDISTLTRYDTYYVDINGYKPSNVKMTIHNNTLYVLRHDVSIYKLYAYKLNYNLIVKRHRYAFAFKIDSIVTLYNNMGIYYKRNKLMLYNMK